MTSCDIFLEEDRIGLLNCGEDDDLFIKSVIQSSKAAFGDDGAKAQERSDAISAVLAELRKTGGLEQYKKRYIQCEERLSYLPVFCREPRATDITKRIYARGKLVQWLRAHVCGPALGYAFAGNAIVWCSFVVTPFLAYRVTECTPSGFAEIPDYILYVNMSVLLLAAFFEMLACRYTFPAHVAVAGPPTALGVSIWPRAFVALSFVLTIGAHMDVATNSLFLAKAWKTEECHSDGETVTEALNSIFSASKFSLVRQFANVNCSSLVFALWAMILSQPCYAIAFSVPLSRSFDLELKDRDLKGRFITYPVAWSSQHHHDDALIALAESGRMGGVKFQAWSYMKSGADQQLYYAGQLYTEMARSVSRCLCFMVFESAFQMNLQGTFVALTRRVTGGDVDWQTVASVVLSVLVAGGSFILIWTQVHEQYQCILTAPIWHSGGQEGLAKRRYDIMAKSRARRLLYIFNIIASLLCANILYTVVKLVMITQFCKYGWNLEINFETLGCVFPPNHQPDRVGAGLPMGSRPLEFLVLSLSLATAAFATWRGGCMQGTPHAGTLIYPLTPENEESAREMVADVDGGATVLATITKQLPGWAPLEQVSPRRADKSLMFVYTDAEPDDLMAIAQLWEFRRAKDGMKDHPLVAVFRDFAGKDKGQVATKKRLLFAQIVGLDEAHVLAKEGLDESVAGLAASARDATLAAICDQLEAFTGDVIDFYIMGPGYGNLRAVVDCLKSRGRWPLGPRWRLTLYSGAFNMKGMSDGDIEALTELMAESDAPLVDLSKFPFFGGAESHPWTQSLTTFVTPDFAMNLVQQQPLMAAVMKSFNDEFNVDLIAPRIDKLFNGELPASERERFEKLASKFDAKAPHTFAEQLANDVEFWPRVKGFKKGTIKAFACGGCDSPLCDQLLFLHLWLVKNRPDALNAKEGMWNLNKAKGFTEIKEAGLFKAVQPVLTNPQDAIVLLAMRKALAASLFNHFAFLDKRCCM